jgi:hypothetical protein
MDKLPKVIDMVIEAVSAGELDKVLKAAHVEGTKDFKMAETAAKSALTGLRRDTSF